MLEASVTPLRCSSLLLLKNCRHSLRSLHSIDSVRGGEIAGASLNVGESEAVNAAIRSKRYRADHGEAVVLEQWPTYSYTQMYIHIRRRARTMFISQWTALLNYMCRRLSSVQQRFVGIYGRTSLSMHVKMKDVHVANVQRHA